MTLSQKQIWFARHLPALITHAFVLGYEVKIGEGLRSRRCAELYAKEGKGIVNSLHILGLAQDLLLFKDGVYLVHSEDYEPLGEYWESLSTDEYECSWGGRFGDGDHFSIEHQGVR